MSTIASRNTKKSTRPSDDDMIEQIPIVPKRSLFPNQNQTHSKLTLTSCLIISAIFVVSVLFLLGVYNTMGTSASTSTGSFETPVVIGDESLVRILRRQSKGMC
jgi:hypothetical protein